MASRTQINWHKNKYSVSFRQFSMRTNIRMNPDQIVQKNLDAYNKRDINGFMACLDEHIQLFNLGESKPSIQGLAKIREFYQSLFENSPELHSNIIKRIAIGNKIIDHESITGRNGSDQVIELVLIYEVKNDKIARITVIRE